LNGGEKVAADAGTAKADDELIKAAAAKADAKAGPGKPAAKADANNKA
jgi:nucleoid-associated protein YgaU